MERTSHWAALYFVALMTFGNYVLFNLLVAILVEGFSAEVSINFLHLKVMELLKQIFMGNVDVLFKKLALLLIMFVVLVIFVVVPRYIASVK